jgi:hypothetical protein
LRVSHRIKMAFLLLIGLGVSACTTSGALVDIRGISAHESGGKSGVAIFDFRGLGSRDGCRAWLALTPGSWLPGSGMVELSLSEGVHAYSLPSGTYVLRRVACEKIQRPVDFPKTAFAIESNSLNFVGVLRPIDDSPKEESPNEPEVEARLRSLLVFIDSIPPHSRDRLKSAWTGAAITLEKIEDTPVKEKQIWLQFTSGLSPQEGDIRPDIENCRAQEKTRNHVFFGRLRASVHFELSEAEPFVNFLPGGHTYTSRFTDCLEGVLKRYRPLIDEPDVLSLAL